MDFDVIVIGGGTAGMTAALYARRAGKSVLLLEAETFGGQITHSPRVENYPGIPSVGGNEFASALLDQVTELGVEIALERVVSVEQGNPKRIVTEDGSHTCGAVVLAAGGRHRRLNLAREEELEGRGVSYCAVCDGAFYKGRTVAVVGGGNAALSDARYLAGLCKKVYLIHRRDRFRGEEGAAKNLSTLENVEFVLDSQIAELLGGEALEGVKVRDRAGRERTLTAEGLFVAVGQEPRNQPFADLVSLDESGYIVAGEDCETSAEGIFAAGDCRTKQVRQLTTAAADGAVAGLAACRYLEN